VHFVIDSVTRRGVFFAILLAAVSQFDDPMRVTRTYTTFTRAADVNAHSRVLVGFYFRNETKEGTAYGLKAGNQRLF
jgi:hypothetical protein